MTVIAAIPHDGHVIMACDTALMRRDTYIADVDKISTVLVGPDYAQHALLGISGSRALADLTRHEFDDCANLPQLADQQDPGKADRWAAQVATQLARIATEAQPPLLVDDTESDAEALLAFGPYLWLLSGQAAVPIRTPMAIGSGADAARGVLYAFGELNSIGHDPVAALCMAVRAAIELDAYCGGEIRVRNTLPIGEHEGTGGGR